MIAAVRKCLISRREVAGSITPGEEFLYVILMPLSLSFEHALVLTTKSGTPGGHSHRLCSGRIAVGFDLCAGCRDEGTRSGSIVNGLTARCSYRPGSVGREQS